MFTKKCIHVMEEFVERKHSSTIRTTY